MRALLWGFMLMAICVGYGCSRTEKVVAIEADKPFPYNSLGILEVKQKVPAWTLGDNLRAVVGTAKLSFDDMPASRAKEYQGALRKKLARVAKERYGAHAVVNVEYWPQADSAAFPEGYIYARGEMIRYERFPQEAVV